MGQGLRVDPPDKVVSTRRRLAREGSGSKHSALAMIAVVRRIAGTTHAAVFANGLLYLVASGVRFRMATRLRSWCEGCPVGDMAAPLPCSSVVPRRAPRRRSPGHAAATALLRSCAGPRRPRQRQDTPSRACCWLAAGRAIGGRAKHGAGRAPPGCRRMASLRTQWRACAKRRLEAACAMPPSSKHLHRCWFDSRSPASVSMRATMRSTSCVDEASCRTCR